MEYSISTIQTAIDRIASEVNRALDNGSVLLLVSGGSNINIAVEVRKKLKISNQLTVGLIDERYGDSGHKDSNWQQLMQAGFDSTKLTVMPILHDEDIMQTTKNYTVLLQNAIESHDTVMGVFGIGTDGHTAGIFPHSKTLNSSKLVDTYNAEDYRRITITPSCFKYFNLAFLVAFGEEKREQLELLSSATSAEIQPAQKLKEIPHVILLSDQIGEE